MPLTIFSIPQRVVYTHLCKQCSLKVFPNYMLGGRRYDLAIPELKLLFRLLIRLEDEVREGTADLWHEGERWDVHTFDAAHLMDVNSPRLADIAALVANSEAVKEIPPSEEEFEWEDVKEVWGDDDLILPSAAFVEE